MKTLQDIKEKIEDIINSDFKIEEFNFYDKKYKASNLLRSAQICLNSIGSVHNINEEEKKDLYKLLNQIMKSKLKDLNPNFSEEVLNNMISSYNRGYIIYPMDILVLDDAVFRKEAELNDFGSVYKIKTCMFRNMKPYYNVLDMEFTLSDFDFYSPIRKERLTTEDKIYTSKFISDSINLICKKDIVKPLYELNTNKVSYGYDGLTCGKVHGINAYINMKFDDIGRSLKSKNECDIKLCIQDGDDIILYYIHQFYKDDKPIWNVVKTNNEVWKITEEALKLENKSTNATLTKNKKL